MSSKLPVGHPDIGGLRAAVVRSALGQMIYWPYRQLQRQRTKDVVLERLGDMRLVVPPGVLNPKVMRSGAFLASCVSAEPIAADTTVLDMGTGSGVCAIAAARRSCRVVAVDINPAAVRCARINALLNRVEERVEVLAGDLFAPLSGRRFDLVLFNPPFLRGAPTSDADRAWRSTDVVERFVAELSAHLTSTGCALVLLSTYGGAVRSVSDFRRRDFEVTTVAERCFLNERLTLVRLRPPASPRAH